MLLQTQTVEADRCNHEAGRPGILVQRFKATFVFDWEADRLTWEYALLERFAGRLEEELRRDPDSKSLRISVKKLHPPLDGPVDYAGIEIRRP